MAKFVAGAAVEPMEYDFTAFGGKEGLIPEPTTILVNNFFETIRNIYKEAREVQDARDAIDIEELSSEEMADAFDSMDEDMASATQVQAKTIQAVAALCQDSPSVPELEALPYRALSAFNKWIMQEIAPKSDSSETASRPPTRDRQRAGASRKRKS